MRVPPELVRRHVAKVGHSGIMNQFCCRSIVTVIGDVRRSVSGVPA